MLTATDIGVGKILYDTARHTSQDAFDRLLTNKSRPVAGDILVTKDGTLGRVAIADGSSVCINQSVALLRINQRLIVPEFLSEALQAEGYQQMMAFDAGGTTIKHIYITRLVKMKVAMPHDVSEQVQIAHEIGIIKAKFEAALAAIQREIELMREYRTRLTADVVTGKFDVREAASKLPTEEEIETPVAAEKPLAEEELDLVTTKEV